MILFASTFQWQYLFIAVAIGLLFGMILSKRGKIDKGTMSSLFLDEFLSTMRKGTLVVCRKEDAYKKGKITVARNYPGRSGVKTSSLRKDVPSFIYDDQGGSHIEGIAKSYIRGG